MKKTLIFFIVLCAASIFSFGQCDVNLKPSDNPTLAYKVRGKKCEGAYSAKVGAPSLDLIGFTVGKFSYKLDRNEVIQIENLAGPNIFIRASAIPLNTYYRMDALLGKNEVLKWEVKDVLLTLNIPSNALAVYGWSGSEKDKVFLPVKATSSVSNKSDSKFYVIVRAASNVLGVKFRYSKQGGAFSNYENISDVARASQAVVIPLPADLKGDYNIEIAAMLESKSEWIKNQYHLQIQ